MDFEKASAKIASTKAIVGPIVDYYVLKEEHKKRQELKSLEKPKKKIESEKYLPAIGKRKYLMICEGASASGGLMPGFGREECGYFELKGKPLNAYAASQADFQKNNELPLLYQIMKSEGYEYYISATDQDLDGFIIRGLIIGFFHRYEPESLKSGRVGQLQTPIMASMKDGMPQQWIYSMSQADELSGDIKYFKGLGAHSEDGLKHIIETDGVEQMIEMYDYDTEADETIDSWLNKSRADDRKVKIRNNEFDLIKL